MTRRTPRRTPRHRCERYAERPCERYGERDERPVERVVDNPPIPPLAFARRLGALRPGGRAPALPSDRQSTHEHLSIAASRWRRKAFRYEATRVSCTRDAPPNSPRATSRSRINRRSYASLRGSKDALSAIYSSGAWLCERSRLLGVGHTHTQRGRLERDGAGSDPDFCPWRALWHDPGGQNGAPISDKVNGANERPEKPGLLLGDVSLPTPITKMWLGAAKMPGNWLFGSKVWGWPLTC